MSMAGTSGDKDGKVRQQKRITLHLLSTVSVDGH